MAQQVSGEQGKEGRMISSIERKHWCEKHLDEECKIYCESCKELICVQCQFDGHQRHNLSLASEVVKRFKEELETTETEVQGFQNEAEAHVVQLKRGQASMEQQLQEELDEVKQRHQSKRVKQEREVTGAQEAVKTLAAVTKDLSNVTSDSDTVSVLKLKTRVEEAQALHNTSTPALQGLFSRAVAEAGDCIALGYAVVLADGLDEVKAFVANVSPRCPKKALMFPSVDKPYSYTKKDVKFMTAVTGQQLADSLEIPRPTTTTFKTIGRVSCWVLVSGGSNSHCLIYLYQQPSNKYTTWWLPSLLTVGQAVSQALGASPSSVTDYDTGQDVQLQPVEHWLGSAGSNHLKYCM